MFIILHVAAKSHHTEVPGIVAVHQLKAKAINSAVAHYYEMMMSDGLSTEDRENLRQELRTLREGLTTANLHTVDHIGSYHCVQVDE